MKIFRNHIINALSDAIIFQHGVEKEIGYTSDSAYLATIKEFMEYLLKSRPTQIKFKD